MGLEATVVAGSAREDANIFVPGYSKDDAGKESALGTVTQSWVRQDAADAVSGSLTGTNVTLLFLTLMRGGPAHRCIHRQLHPPAPPRSGHAAGHGLDPATDPQLGA